ncbi:MAG: hypothetical protein EBU46_13230 [Nitrosomonadaceae bacterium]|nr:hypothetical protein [Nitrosomonadaceae bacterium]
MRVALIITACVLALMLFLIGRAAVVDSEYDTLEDARKDGLFGRGWLPDILPESSKDIRVSNNLDINTSDGEFSFNASDYAEFSSRVIRYRSGMAGLEEIDRESHLAPEGLDAFIYLEGEYVWAFFCNKTLAHCQYILRSRRG